MRKDLQPWLRNKPGWIVKAIIGLVYFSILTWGVGLLFISCAFSFEDIRDEYPRAWGEALAWMKADLRMPLGNTEE